MTCFHLPQTGEGVLARTAGMARLARRSTSRRTLTGIVQGARLQQLSTVCPDQLRALLEVCRNKHHQCCHYEGGGGEAKYYRIRSIFLGGLRVIHKIEKKFYSVGRTNKNDRKQRQPKQAGVVTFKPRKVIAGFLLYSWRGRGGEG